MGPLISCHSSNYTKGRTGSIRYIVLHYTGNNGDSARNNCHYFAGVNRKASAHYFVDEKEVCQSVKEEDRAWHCGAESYRHPLCRNSNSVGIEMCSRKDSAGEYYIKQETVENARKLTLQLMAFYNIPAERVLRHYDVTGKDCPRPWVKDERMWKLFLEGLCKKEEEVMVTYEEFKGFMKQYEKEAAAQSVSVWAQSNWERAKSDGLLDGTRPHSAVTRQELAAVIHRLRGGA